MCFIEDYWSSITEDFIFCTQEYWGYNLLEGSEWITLWLRISWRVIYALQY